jgi:hypothetical protein
VRQSADPESLDTVCSRELDADGSLGMPRDATDASVEVEPVRSELHKERTAFAAQAGRPLEKLRQRRSGAAKLSIVGHRSRKFDSPLQGWWRGARPPGVSGRGVRSTNEELISAPRKVRPYRCRCVPSLGRRGADACGIDQPAVPRKMRRGIHSCPSEQDGVSPAEAG